MTLAPVITIDGPTASGKGTVAHEVAQRLGWAVLDSGVLYRLTALAALNHAISLTDEKALAQIAQNLQVSFENGEVYLEGQAVAKEIRQETVSHGASKVAVFPAVRQALLARQRAFRQLPGLVADGRDMGTVVFPDAALKIFLTADVVARAERRCKQLKKKGIPVILQDLLQAMRERDERDAKRPTAPLFPAHDAWLLDSSAMTVQETVQAILARWDVCSHSTSVCGNVSTNVNLNSNTPLNSNLGADVSSNGNTPD